jgi:hypothetical protein
MLETTQARFTGIVIIGGLKLTVLHFWWCPGGVWYQSSEVLNVMIKGGVIFTFVHSFWGNICSLSKVRSFQKSTKLSAQ